MSWLLIIIAITVATTDWFTAKPKPGEATWPRWTKLTCAVLVAGIGVLGLLQGLVARSNGIDSYKERALIEAIEQLNVAYKSPFKNRQVLDYLGLAHKNIADQAVDGPVAEVAYASALKYFTESRIRYPKAPFAKNNMINVYRHLKQWDKLMPLARSFESEIKANNLHVDGNPLTKKQKAIFLVTLSNVFAEQDNPSRSDEHAVALYQLALELDKDNMYVMLNMPPRLIDMAKKLPITSKKRKQYLEKALELSVAGLELEEDRDKVFSVLAIIQIMMMEKSPPVPIPNYTLVDALKFIDTYNHAQDDFDLETWFILTEAHLKQKQKIKANAAFNQAMVYQARFTQEQVKWANALWDKLGTRETFPFQQRIHAGSH